MMQLCPCLSVDQLAVTVRTAPDDVDWYGGIALERLN